MSTLTKSSQRCETCGSRRGKAIYDDNEHCFSCGEHKSMKRTFAVREQRTVNKLPWTGQLPEDYCADTPPPWVHEWLNLFNFKYDVAWSQSVWGWSKKLNRLIFPIYSYGELKAYQARAYDREPKWITCSPNYPWGKKHPYLRQPIGTEYNPAFSNTWVIVEDIMSAHVVGNVFPCISILGTTVNKALVNFLLTKGNRFIIWMDSDEAGEKAVKKLSTLIGMCAKISIIRSEKDPKYYSSSEIMGKIKLC